MPAITLGQFTPTFHLRESLLAYLTTPHETESTTLSSCPRYLTLGLDRTHHHIALVEPSISAKITPAAVVNCCISHGLSQIDSHPKIQTSLALVATLHTTGYASPLIYETLYDWVGSFHIYLPSTSNYRPTNRYYRLDTALKGRLSALAARLGTPLSNLASFAIVIALATQSYPLPQHQQQMKYAIDGFFEWLDLHHKISHLLIKNIGSGDI